MSTKVYAGTEVTVNDDGFFADARQWREEMAPEIAREAGIGALTPQHWQVVKLLGSAARLPKWPGPGSRTGAPRR